MKELLIILLLLLLSSLVLYDAMQTKELIRVIVDTTVEIKELNLQQEKFFGKWEEVVNHGGDSSTEDFLKDDMRGVIE